MAANNAPNMKVVVGADTSQFDKGMRAAKAQVRDFSKVSSDALGKLGEAFGVNTAQIEKVTGAIGGLGQRMAQAGSEGTKAFGNLLSSVTKLNTGLVGLGLAGVVASFKALNAEAENFKSTVAGANIELQTQAYINTYRQVLHDTNSETGRAVAEWQSNWQKGVARLGANLQQRFISMNTGQAFLGPVWGLVAAGDRDQRRAATEAAETAEQIQGRLYELTRKQSDATRQIADLDAEIANYKLIARDETYSTAERMQAIDKVTAAIQQKYSILLPIEQERTRLMDEMVSLAGSTPAEIDAANQQYVKATALEKQMADEQRELLRLTNSLNKANNANNAELQKQLDLQRQIAQSRADLAALDLSTSGSLSTGSASALSAPGLAMPGVQQIERALYAQLGDSLYLRVSLEPDQKSFIDLTNQINNVVAGLSVSMSEAIGGLIGDLVTGGDAWGNFANAAMSAFGDMATSVGKIAIECGVASLGIKAALTNLGPAGAAVAIAAGTALVALGAAVKTGLSNIAAGNYSASPAVASGSYSAGSNDYETREVQVNVTGTLQADGDKLVAVLNNTNNRNGYTT